MLLDAIRYTFGYHHQLSVRTAISYSVAEKLQRPITNFPEFVVCPKNGSKLIPTVGDISKHLVKNSFPSFLKTVSRIMNEEKKGKILLQSLVEKNSRRYYVVACWLSLLPRVEARTTTYLIPSRFLSYHGSSFRWFITTKRELWTWNTQYISRLTELHQSPYNWIILPKGNRL